MFKFFKKKKVSQILIPTTSNIFKLKIASIEAAVENIKSDDDQKYIDYVLICYRFKAECEQLNYDSKKWLEKHNNLKNDLTDDEISDIFSRLKNLISAGQSFIKKGLAAKQQIILKDLIESVEDYGRLHHYAGTANDPLLIDDFDYLIDLRENIHILFGLVENQDSKDIIEAKSTVKSIDAEVVSLAKKSQLITALFMSQDFPNSHWWWHLHEIDKLSKADLETV